ncbi:MAG: hypothetical protein ACC658_10670, partial [Acidimicrobiia bacterium]
MGRRDFIRNMFITAAVAAAEKTSLGQVLKNYGGCVLTPDKSIRVDHLPDDMRWSTYDNFDGRGGWQTGTGENIAVDGEFSPRLWSFYQGTPTIETL